jgi:hypothetical protein
LIFDSLKEGDDLFEIGTIGMSQEMSVGSAEDTSGDIEGGFIVYAVVADPFPHPVEGRDFLPGELEPVGKFWGGIAFIEEASCTGEIGLHGKVPEVGEASGSGGGGDGLLGCELGVDSKVDGRDIARSRERSGRDGRRDGRLLLLVTLLLLDYGHCWHEERGREVQGSMPGCVG